jgi:hypothetical protein
MAKKKQLDPAAPVATPATAPGAGVGTGAPTAVTPPDQVTNTGGITQRMNACAHVFPSSAYADRGGSATCSKCGLTVFWYPQYS